MFEIGVRVTRKEARDVTGAEVLTIVTGGDEPLYQIAYDEGGSGWWPETALEAEEI